MKNFALFLALASVFALGACAESDNSNNTNSNTNSNTGVAVASPTPSPSVTPLANNSKVNANK